MTSGERSPGGARVRNIGIVAHINAGKTTLTERILFDTGAQQKLGEVDLGTATTDYLAEEQRRGISINAAVATVQWRGYRVNLIDTPGHVDFAAEVERCLRVLDGLVVLLDGIKGVESQTLMIWRRARLHGLPALLFVNKLDRATADFAAAIESARRLLDVRPVPIVLPLRHDDGDVMPLDLLAPAAPPAGPARTAQLVAAGRGAIVEACAEVDERVLAAFVEGYHVEAPLLHRALRTGTLTGRLLPVLGGAALRNRGVDLLLDAVCRYLPSPLDPVRELPAEDLPRRPQAAAGPCCALVFKVQHDGADRFQFVRVWTGGIAVGDVLSTPDGRPVQVRAIWSMLALERRPLADAAAGDVVVVDTDLPLVSGDLLGPPGGCAPLAPMEFPEPNLSITIEPTSAADRDALVEAVRRLSSEDPTLAMQEDPETGVAVVAGLGELHLEVFAERLAAATRLRFRCGRPRIRCRSAVRTGATADAECRTIVGTTPVGMSVSVRVTPGDPDRHARVVVAEGLIGPAAGAAEAALRQLAEAGVASPHPLFGAELELLALAGDARPPQAAALAAEAAQIALRKAVASADPFELEPWTRVEVLAPREVLSGILADLQARGGEVELVEPTDLGTQVRGVMPLAAAIGYPTQLRSLSRGLADLLMLPADYRPRAAARGAPGQEKAAGELDRGGGAR